MRINPNLSFERFMRAAAEEADRRMMHSGGKKRKKKNSPSVFFHEQNKIYADGMADGIAAGAKMEEEESE